MLFSAAIFLWTFLPLTVLVNCVLPTQLSNLFLLLASLLFYAWGEPVYVFLMLFSITINWLCGLLIDKFQAYKTPVLILCTAINLALLGYFKYFNFFVDSINAIFGGGTLSAKTIALPIGISFFTFQALSYVIDLYRGNCSVQKNLLHLALYVSFFPQLIAGPIVRYADIATQLQNRTVSAERFALGLRRFLYGLGKKVILSNCMAEITDCIFGLAFAKLTPAGTWLGALTYTLQIYYDFSGYSDMAIGLGHIFGFYFLENFNYPYLSRSIREFWQRWHISLGTWFREYVYIPLGGNRKGVLRTYFNLIAVFFLTGMWHGANWTFIVWGLYHGAFQILERLRLKNFLQQHPLLSHCYCMFVVITGWVVFRAETLGDATRYFLRMFVPWRYSLIGVPPIPLELLSWRNLVMFCVAVMGCGILQLAAQRWPILAAKWKNSVAELLFLCTVFVYSMILLASGSYNPFIYFRF